MNGLPAIADNLASQGRYGDSMLVHMTPQEVGGLQALAQSQGTSLTTNPETGLPEAFKLKQLLPMIAGFALGPAGLALMPAWGAGLAVGGIEALRTGDLGKGLMAGLGAYGGAGLGAAMTGAGSAAAAPITDATLAQGAPMLPGVTAQAAPSLANLGNLGISDLGSAAASSVGSPGTVGMATRGFGATSFAAPAVTPPAAAAAAPAASGASPGFFSRYTAAMANPLTSAKTGAIVGGLGVAAPFMEPEPLKLPETEDPYAKYKGPYTPTKRTVRYPGSLDSREFMYFDPSNPVPFKQGGSVPELEDGGFVLTKKAVDGLGKGSNKKGQQAAAMGLGALPIRGKGTGTSDSIKTSIDGKVPARVSNGEAYVPKRNVQRAGGAKKLYALMRKAERRA